MPSLCQSVTCPAQAVGLGFNSEATDVIQFTGLGYGPLTPPPLGWSFDRPTAFAIAYGPTQAAADQVAFSNASFQAQATWFSPTELPPQEWEMPAEETEWVPPLT